MKKAAQIKAAPSTTPKQKETLWRTLQTFNATRVVIAVVLFGYLSFSTKKGYWAEASFLYQEVCGVYLLFALAFTGLTAYWKRRFLLQVASQVTVDVIVISLLYVAAGGTKGGLAILYLFPLAGGAILAPRLLALFFVSIVTLILLAESGYQLLTFSNDALIMQSGLYGAAFFAAVFVINRLAARLINQEKLAIERGRDLSVQQAINRLVIADMSDGILVVDRDGTVVTANPAAERMLAMPLDEHSGHSLDCIHSLAPIADAFFAWAAKPGKHARGAAAPVFVMIKPGEDLILGTTIGLGGRRDLAVHLKLRFTTVDTADSQLERTVIFLQDVSEIENKAQQLKLASMGRLTASIAHEVRNPLSAISYAASLLEEEIRDTAHGRLLNIVGDNVKRLNRMIEDILKLSRKAQSAGTPLELVSSLTEIVAEFTETNAIERNLIRMDRAGSHQVFFDPMHLREVVVNLLSNAMRYASGNPGSISLRLVTDPLNRLELHVQDDGPAITPKVRAHLFEPFYTTSHKGTGLGLYLARELCLNNGAMLDYEYRTETVITGGRSSGRFVILFSVPDAT